MTFDLSDTGVIHEFRSLPCGKERSNALRRIRMYISYFFPMEGEAVLVSGPTCKCAVFFKSVQAFIGGIFAARMLLQ